MSEFVSSHNRQEETHDENRRKVLLGMSIAAAAAYSGVVHSAMPGHDHSKHAAQLPDVLSATNHCLDKGQRCIAHCLVSFQEGDVELAKCASKVHEMHAVCDAFSYLLASNSDYIKQYAAVCSKVCQDCEKECLKHKEHIECKDCADACADLIDQIKLRIS